MVAHVVRQLFISSTVQDLNEYRKEVQDVLFKKAEIGSFLSKDWQGGFDDTVEKCQDRVTCSDGYVGIFAYYYGSIPPDHDKSITHLEFQWAKKKWGGCSYPLLAVFMPDPDGEADYDLREKAKNLVRSKDEGYQKKHLSLLKAFHNEVQNPERQWRTINYFVNKNDLRERVLVTCATWKASLMTAARQRKNSVGSITDEELGLLGRTDHINVVKETLSEVTDRPGVPAVALLIYGDEDAGQKEFCKYLFTIRQLRPRRGAPILRGHPHQLQYDLETLIQWTSQCLTRQASLQTITTIDQLAELINGALEHHQVTVLLDHAERFLGGVKAFQQTFWKPLYAKLEALVKKRPSKHRLIFCIVAYSADTAPYEGGCCDAKDDASDIDYSGLLKLPELISFQERDIRHWIDEIGIPDDSPGRRKELRKASLTTPNGQVDGTPRRVFERLCHEINNIWPDGGWRDE